jgi:hypothetical protein
MKNLKQLELQKDLQMKELSLANNRISQLQNLLLEDKNNSKRQQSDQYLKDELSAWKELVEQQKAIMEKIRNELENTQSLVREKDKVIDTLRRPSSSTSNDSLKYEVETQTENEINFNSIDGKNSEAIIRKNSISNSNDYFNDDELGLSTLFGSQEFENLNNLEEKEMDLIDMKSGNNTSNKEVGEDLEKENIKFIPQVWTEPQNETIRSNNSSKNSYYSKNDGSDVCILYNRHDLRLN